VYVDPAVSGAEIEIRHLPGAWDGRHTQARRRLMPGGGGATCAAVFESLDAGRYELRLRRAVAEAGVEAGVVIPLEIRGGEVTEVVWPNLDDA
jgi:hypothetical protein